MKTIIFLLAVSFLQLANADELLDKLKGQFPAGLYTGTSPANQKKCFVSIKHDNIVEDWAVRSEFELSLFDYTRQNKSIYRYSTMIAGGRGDCPHVIIDQADHLKIRNTSTGAPCFAKFDRTNHGGFEFFKNGNQWLFFILTPSLDVLQSCMITK
jgi:hypothetical protein